MWPNTSMNKIIQEDLATICSYKAVDWDRFNNKTVLVTGANGMLPSYLVYTLLYLTEIKGYKIKVIALVRNIDKATAKFKHYLNSGFLTLLVQDVASPIDIEGNLDYIIHAASQASPKYYGIDPVGTINANVQGTINVLALAREKHSKSVLYVSSGEVYGKKDDGIPNTENEYGLIDPLSVRSCYGQSKRMGETLCVCWNYQFNTHAKIVRPFHCFGPGMLLNDGRVFADFIGNILRNEDIVIHSDGSAVRAFCYITDATIQFFKVLLDGHDSEAYNVGNSNNAISIKELAETLTTLYPEKKLKVVVDIDENDLRTSKMKSPLSVSIPDTHKIEVLGIHPKVSIKDGFNRTIESLGRGIPL